MKTDFIQCAWNESCGKSVKRDFKKPNENFDVIVQYTKCNKCGKQTVQDEKGKIIKYTKKT